MTRIDLGSELLNYLATSPLQPGDRLPSISELAEDAELDMSTAKLREQLSIARAFGLVDVQTKNGMQLQAYDFRPAVSLSLQYALARAPDLFDFFAELRVQLEVAFWGAACANLKCDRLLMMRELVEGAKAMLRGQPIRIPYHEHREFHLNMFRDLNNPFVIGLLEAYWEAYELVERNRYRDYAYLHRVWDYHERILEHLSAGEVSAARMAFIEHTRLLYTPPWRAPEREQEESKGKGSVLKLEKG